MSKLLARIVLAMLLPPFAGMIWTILDFLADEFTRWPERRCALFSFCFTAAFVGTCWIGLWRRYVRWSARRIIATIVCTILAAIVALVIKRLLAPEDATFGVVCGGITGAMLWLILTVVVWQDTPSEHRSRMNRSASRNLVCPACGYSMTGLTDATCPECGAKYTISELIAAQPGNELIELEA